MNQAKREAVDDSPDPVGFWSGGFDLSGDGRPDFTAGPLPSVWHPGLYAEPPEASEAAAQQAAQLGADPGAAERLQTRRNDRTLEEAKVLPVIKPRRTTV